MERAEVRISTASVGSVSPYLFGALTEHFGSGMYGGIWDQERDIPRSDVLAATRGMGLTMARYPGGCFSDWYHWRDGIGPKNDRPIREHTYWTDFRLGDAFTDEMARQFGPVETNQVGTDEFLRWCLDAGVEPMIVANFGTGDPEEAAAWVRYCNVDRRAPRPVRWWGVGNETYGDWELGHCPPDEYARRYVEYVQAMRAVDPDIAMVAVGLTVRPGQADTGWNQTVLQRAAEHVDALSVHWYFPGPWLGRGRRWDEGDYLQLAAASDELGAALDRTLATVDAATDRQIPLSVDEWNLWFEWRDLLTTNHALSDSVFFAGVLNRLLERADRVQFAMVSHLVNCMAPIQTRGDRHFVTPLYLTLLLYRQVAGGRALKVEVEAPEQVVPPFADVRVSALSHTDIPHNAERRTTMLDAAAVQGSGRTTVFLANRALDRPLEITVRGLPPGARGILRHLCGEGPFARNDEDDPTRVGFTETPYEVAEDGSCAVLAPPHVAGALILDDPTAPAHR